MVHWLLEKMTAHLVVVVVVMLVVMLLRRRHRALALSRRLALEQSGLGPLAAN